MSANGSHASIEALLGALDRADASSLPQPSAELREAVRSGGASSLRRPRRRALIAGGFGVAQAVLIVSLLGLRRDIGGLPVAWLLAYLGAWALAFAALASFSLIPARGQVMPRSAPVGLAGIAAALAFAACGVVFAVSVPGVSTTYEASLANIIRFAPYCLTVGTATAILPLFLAAMLARGSAPVGAAWLGAGVGASAGSLGGLVLHLHCPIAEGTHLGLVHGGVVAIAATVGAIFVPILSRVR